MDKMLSVALIYYALAMNLQDVTYGQMTITTPENLFVPSIQFVINCTSAVPVTNDIIQYTVNDDVVVTIRYLNSNGQCLYLLPNTTIPSECNANCGCDLNGRSTFYRYSYGEKIANLTLRCAASTNKVGSFFASLVLETSHVTYGHMTTTTPEHVFVPFKPLAINCTAAVPLKNGIIHYIVDDAFVFTIRYLNGTGQCLYLLPNTTVPSQCKANCGCDLHGRSTVYRYSYGGKNTNLTLQCIATSAVDGSSLISTLVLEIAVSITSAIITPTGNNAMISVVTDATQIFTCSTDAGRPAASIKWYIGEQNVTDHAYSVITQDGTKYLTSSALTYTGKDADHNKQIYCEAFNIAGSQKVKSNTKTLNIQVLVRTLTLIPGGVNNVVTVALGDTREFTCTTDPIRPAAWIQWYFGSRNVTNNAVPKLQPDGTKFIAFSRLTIAGNENDQNKTIHCEAQNIQGMPIVKSLSKILYIGFQPEPVSGISVACDGTTLVVLWQSGSDRGSKQIFGVVWQNLQSDSIMRSENITDPGIGLIVHYTTNLISAKAYYTINIESTNVYGTVRSNKLVYCNTIGSVTASMPVTESTILYAVVGSGTAMIVSIAVVAFIVVYAVKRKRRSPADRRNQEGNGDRTYEEMDTVQTNLRSNVSKTEL